MGSTRSGIIAMVLRGTLSPVLIGIMLGIPAALYVGYLSASLLYGIRSSNPVAYLAAVGALAVSAAVAGFLPAHRAASSEGDARAERTVTETQPMSQQNKNPLPIP